MYFRVMTRICTVIGLDGTFLEEVEAILERESPLQFTYVGTASLLLILSTTAEAQRDTVSCPKSHSLGSEGAGMQM